MFKGFSPQLWFCVCVVRIPDVYISTHIYKVYTCTCVFLQSAVWRAVPSRTSILLPNTYSATRNINTSASPVTVSLPEGALENIATETLISADSRAPPGGKPAWIIPSEGLEGRRSSGRLGSDRQGGQTCCLTTFTGKDEKCGRTGLAQCQSARGWPQLQVCCHTHSVLICCKNLTSPATRSPGCQETTKSELADCPVLPTFFSFPARAGNSH